MITTTKREIDDRSKRMIRSAVAFAWAHCGNTYRAAISMAYSWCGLDTSSPSMQAKIRTIRDETVKELAPMTTAEANAYWKELSCST